MKQRILLTLAIVSLLALACAKNETSSTESTDTSTTSVSMTDTSSTTSTTDTSASGTTGTSASLSDADKDIVTKIAQANIAEIMAGQMAAGKATNADVKSFANQMVQDHGKAGDELKALASGKGLTLPTDTDAEHKAAADKLSKLSGKAFDKAYMDQMVKDHDKAAADFDNASKNAADPDLKNWASKTLPTIQDHQKMSKDIHAKLK